MVTSAHIASSRICAGARWAAAVGAVQTNSAGRTHLDVPPGRYLIQSSVQVSYLLRMSAAGPR